MAWISCLPDFPFRLFCIPHFMSITFVTTAYAWISLVKLFLFRIIVLKGKVATRWTVPKYSKRNRKPEAAILYEVRTPHWEEIVTFFYNLERKKHRLMGNLQLNVRKDSYDFDNTPLHIVLYIYFKFGIWLRGNTHDLHDFRLPPRSRW